MHMWILCQRLLFQLRHHLRQVITTNIQVMAFSGSSAGKESACNAGGPGLIPGQEDPLEKGQATHSSILGLPWWLRQKESASSAGQLGSIPWVGKIHWRRAWQPTPVFLPGESSWTEEPGGLQSHGVTKSLTGLSTAQHPSYSLIYEFQLRSLQKIQSYERFLILELETVNSKLLGRKGIF